MKNPKRTIQDVQKVSLDDIKSGELDRVGIMPLSVVLNQLHLIKERTYGASWEKRGEMGILHNIFRKIDRIEQAVNEVHTSGSYPLPGDESLTETIADLAVYSLLWLDRMSEVDPASFVRWVAALNERVRDSEEGAPPAFDQAVDQILTCAHKYECE